VEPITWRPSDYNETLVSLLVSQKIELIQNSPNVALRMKIARRAELPFSEVSDRWSDDDLLMERAQDFLDFERHMDQCPKCGTDPNDILGDDGRVMDGGPIQVYTTNCPVCPEVAKIEKDMSETDRDAGKYVRLRPRPPGAPFVDDYS